MNLKRVTKVCMANVPVTGIAFPVQSFTVSDSSETASSGTYRDACSNTDGHIDTE